MLAGLIALLIFILFGGIRWVKVSGQGLRETLKITWALPAFTLVLFVVSVIQALLAGGFAENMGVNLLGTLVLCIGIGLLEEALYRGVLLNSLLAPLGRSRAAVIFYIIASSLIFRWAHVWLDDMDEGSAMILAALKTL